MYLKNYSVIEDLCQSIHQHKQYKDYPQRFYDLMIRNYSLLKHYSKDSDIKVLTKFKKKIIPKHLQHIEIYVTTMKEKKRQLFYQKRRSSQTSASIRKPSSLHTNGFSIFHNCEVQTDNSISGSNQDNNCFNNIGNNNKGQLQRQATVNTLKKVSKQYRQSLNLKVSSILEQDNSNLDQTLKNSRHTIEPGRSSQSPHIYERFSNLSKKNFFKASLNQLSKLNRNRKSQQILPSFQSHRNSYGDERSFQKNMIKILKKKRSIKNQIYSMISPKFCDESSISTKLKNAFPSKSHKNIDAYLRTTNFCDQRFQMNHNCSQQTLNIGLQGRHYLPNQGNINNRNTEDMSQKKTRQKTLVTLDKVSLREFLPGFAGNQELQQVQKLKSKILATTIGNNFKGRKFMLPKFT